jgi:hypothetical protein
MPADAHQLGAKGLLIKVIRLAKFDANKKLGGQAIIKRWCSVT